MATDNDRLEMREAIKLTREILTQSSFKPLNGEELSPGSHVQ